LKDTYLKRAPVSFSRWYRKKRAVPVADAMPLMIVFGSRFAASINSLNVLNFESIGTVTDWESNPKSASGV
jgi:hypothetical protein